MRVVVATVDMVHYDGEAVSLTAPGSEGELTVLGGHMPLVTLLKQGTVVVRTADSSEQSFPIMGGVLEVRHDGATVLL